MTYGPVAVAITARAGQQLDDWQADAMDVMLGIRADGKWACRDYCEWVSRQNGKGSIGEARVLVGFIGPLREKLILWSAHEYKTAMEAHRRIGWLLKNLGTTPKDNLILIPDHVFETPGDIRIKIYNTNGEESYERLDTGQRVKFIARTKGSGRGFGGTNIIDEAFAYTNQQHSALKPTLSAQPNPQMIYLSSPPLTGDTGERMYHLRKRAEAGGASVRSLGYRDWGMAGDLGNLAVIDLGDRRNWAATNPALGADRESAITEETIEEEYVDMDELDFARERLGIWPAQAKEGNFQVIPESAWQDCYDQGATIVGRPALAVFVAPDRSYSAIVAAGDTPDGMQLVELTGKSALQADGTIKHVFDYFAGTAQVIGRLREMEKNNPSVIVIDDKALADEAEKQGLVIHRSNVSDVVTGCQLFFDGTAGPDLAGRTVRHLGQKDMTDAVSRAVKRKVGNSWAWDFPDPPLGAASLALFGHATPRVHRPAAQPFFAAWA
jgi:hypothetical protein